MATDLDAALLRAFVAAIRGGSLSRAAVSLGRSQPALSQQLRRLEDLVGEPLLRRGPGGVTPTEAGDALLPYAERILALSAQALDGARRHRALSGRCGVGLLEDLAASALPSALAEFARQHPQVSLEILAASGSAMNEALESGRIQLALCDAGYMRQPARWTRHTPVIWMVGVEAPPLGDPLPLVLFSEPCRWRAPMLAQLDGVGRPWRIAFESNSLSGMQAAVRAGLGAAGLLPANLIAGMRPAGPADRLPALPDVEISLVRRPGTEGDPIVDAVEELLRRMA